MTWAPNSECQECGGTGMIGPWGNEQLCRCYRLVRDVAGVDGLPRRWEDAVLGQPPRGREALVEASAEAWRYVRLLDVADDRVLRGLLVVQDGRADDMSWLAAATALAVARSGRRVVWWGWQEWVAATRAWWTEERDVWAEARGAHLVVLDGVGGALVGGEREREAATAALARLVAERHADCLGLALVLERRPELSPGAWDRVASMAGVKISLAFDAKAANATARVATASCNDKSELQRGRVLPAGGPGGR